MYISLLKKIGNVDFNVKSVTPLKSEPFEFLYDLDFSMFGKFWIEIKSEIKLLNQKFPFEVRILLKSITGKIRICWVSGLHGKSWFSFIGEPRLDLSIDPVLGKSRLSINNLPQAKELIHTMVKKKFKTMTHPNKKTMKIPLTKKAFEKSI